MSGGRSSSSNASNQTDKRIAQESGAAISGDGSSITINSVDGGIVARALDSVDASNATAGEGFTQLLGAAKELFNKGESLIGTTQKNVVDAYAQEIGRAPCRERV